jgi:hypothetical protein
MHDHIRKWGRWNPEESPHDFPHYTVTPRLRDYYKRARAEAKEEETRVQHTNEGVDDLEGFSVQE